jgi:hypothetical protein
VIENDRLFDRQNRIRSDYPSFMISSGVKTAPEISKSVVEETIETYRILQIEVPERNNAELLLQSIEAERNSISELLLQTIEAVSPTKIQVDEDIFASVIQEIESKDNSVVDELAEKEKRIQEDIENYIKQLPIEHQPPVEKKEHAVVIEESLDNSQTETKLEFEVNVQLAQTNHHEPQIQPASDNRLKKAVEYYFKQIDGDKQYSDEVDDKDIDEICETLLKESVAQSNNSDSTVTSAEQTQLSPQVLMTIRKSSTEPISQFDEERSRSVSAPDLIILTKQHRLGGSDSDSTISVDMNEILFRGTACFKDEGDEKDKDVYIKLNTRVLTVQKKRKRLRSKKTVRKIPLHNLSVTLDLFVKDIVVIEELPKSGIVTSKVRTILFKTKEADLFISTFQILQEKAKTLDNIDTDHSEQSDEETGSSTSTTSSAGTPSSPKGIHTLRALIRGGSLQNLKVRSTAPQRRSPLTLHSKTASQAELEELSQSQ